MKAQARQNQEKQDNIIQARRQAGKEPVHPLIQLQRTIGNKAVTNMVQRHSRRHMEQYGFQVVDKDGNETTLYS